MLKIKDDVNLKELEKFGFKYNDDTESYDYHKKIEGRIDNITVSCNDKKIVYDNGYNIVYDLIIANLVENVEE